VPDTTPDTATPDTATPDTATPDTATPDTATPDTAILDVDGTLVDTNYQHSLAWYRAFRRYDLDLPVWRLHRAIGMGGDRLVAAVAGDDVERRHGDDLRAAWTEEFDALLPEVTAFEGVRELLASLRARGLKVVLASSGKSAHVDHYLGLFDGRELADAWTTADDVDSSKPAPDLLEVALDRVGGRSGVVVGDSVWDFRAAARIGAPGYAVRTGGFADCELREAGARDVFDSPAELLAGLDATALSG
jgi:HAD superfamily hydrolase (TIGR01549 family)